MPKGKYPFEYANNPNIDKSITEIYRDLDAYTGEFFEDEKEANKLTDFIIPLPPLKYEGKTLKGMFLSQGVDFIHSLFPEIGEIFFSMAFSMWCSIPWSRCADVYLNCYENWHREDWFKKTNPDRANKIFLPLQDADFTNEYFMAPTFNTPKDIDVLCVSRLAKVKNLPMLIRALKLYHEKYKVKLKAVLIVGKELQGTGLTNTERSVLEEITRENASEYIEILGYVKYSEMSKFYTRAKVLVLPSLIEGKNRAINEAISCNTPVIVFSDYNKYARNGYPIFKGNCGLYVPKFEVEALSDTIFKAVKEYKSFTPRKDYLTHCGRKNFLNKCIDSIPYYKENLPDYKPNDIQSNLWVDLAMQDNYQLSFNDFLYGKNLAIQQVKVHENSKSLIEFFYSRFNVKKRG